MQHKYEFEIPLESEQVFCLVEELSPHSTESNHVHPIRTVKGPLNGKLFVFTPYSINPDLIKFYLLNWSKS